MPADDKTMLVKHLLWRAGQIHRQLQAGIAVQAGIALQVRWHEGRVLTYTYPVRRGYGVRGLLVAVYSADAELEWIEADLLALLSDTRAPAHA